MNPIEPEVWDHILHEPLAQAAELDEGGRGLVSQTHHRRTYTLSYTAAPVPKKRRKREPTFAEGLLTGLLATADEGTEGVFTPSTPVDTRCDACGGAVPVDGSARAAPCPFCGVTLVVPDDLWTRLHPEHGVHPWILVVEEAAPLEEPTWAGDAVSTPDGVIFAGTVAKGAGLFAESSTGRAMWRRLDFGAKAEKLRFCLAGGVLWVSTRKRVLQLDPRSGATLRELDLPAVRDARELCVCPDGRVLLPDGRRVAVDGTVSGGWAAPEPLGFFARFFSEPTPTGPYEGAQTRLAVSADGSVWQIGVRQFGPTFVARLDPQGRRRWARDLADVQPTDSPPQPGPEGAWFFVWGDNGARVVAFSPDGTPGEGPSWGRFKDGAWDGVPRFVRTADAGIVYDLWGKVRRFAGGAVLGNTTARDADREAAGEEEEEDS